MGARGPQPSFASVSGAAGGRDPGHRAKRETVEFAGGEVSRRRGLPKGARAVWDELLPQLQTAGRGFVKPIDASVFEMLCAEVARWRGLYKTLETEGWTYETATGFVRPRPEAAQYQDAMNNVMRIGREFGIAPGLRQRLELSGDMPEAQIMEFPEWGEAWAE